MKITDDLEFFRKKKKEREKRKKNPSKMQIHLGGN